MDLNRTIPPLPKRSQLPKERPSLDLLQSATTAGATQETEDSRWQNSFALLDLLNQSREPQREREPEPELKKVAAPKPAVLTAPTIKPSLRFPWLFWTFIGLFIAMAVGLFFWMPRINTPATSNSALPIKRDLKETMSLPDPSSPTAVAPETGDPIPSLKPPTKPSRD